jgi:hypothetical protein
MTFLKRIPDLPLAMTLLWMWCVVAFVVVVSYFVVRRWNRRHPAPRPDQRPYTQQLRRRLAQEKHGGADPVGSRNVRIEVLLRRFCNATKKEHQ